MQLQRTIRITFGAAIWLALAWGLWSAWSTDGAAAKPDRVASAMWTYYAGDYPEARLEFEEPADLAVGDLIFHVRADGAITRMGEVRALDVNGVPARRGDVQSAQAMFYPGAPLVHARSRIEYFSADQSLFGAMRTMFPPGKRREIARLIAKAYEQHNEEIGEVLWPIVHGTLRQTLFALEKELALSIAAHREELRAVGAKYQQEIIADDVIPLVRNEVWPIVRKRGEPAANEIGREIWERLSLWRFGWRMLYDKTPLLPERNLTRKEWRRFVDAEIVPVLENHTEDMVKVTQGILRDVGKNPKVRAALRANLSKMLDDPELQKIIGKIVREVVIENDELRSIFKEHWSHDDARQALRLVSDRLEPTTRKIGELVLGKHEQISPEFALVLRNYALAKDRRWICVFEEGDADAESSGTDQDLLTLKVAAGGETDINPFMSFVGRDASQPVAPGGADSGSNNDGSGNHP